MSPSQAISSFHVSELRLRLLGDRGAVRREDQAVFKWALLYSGLPGSPCQCSCLSVFFYSDAFLSGLQSLSSLSDPLQGLGSSESPTESRRSVSLHILTCSSCFLNSGLQTVQLRSLRVCVCSPEYSVKDEGPFCSGNTGHQGRVAFGLLLA